MFYDRQTHGTTACYVDTKLVCSAQGNDQDAERLAIAAMTGDGTKRFVERVVFGHGRVALVFVTA